MKRLATTLLVAGLMAAPMLALPPPASAAVNVEIAVGIAPPPLPVYAQPMAPAPGYLWTPGYWAWGGPAGYYWVPGAWVMPPEPGLLWTPGWWGWSAGFYRWNPGYWGVRVGFYGGINYGYGYYGSGYVGGYWRGRNFYYNRAVNNINVTNIRNVYINRTVINNRVDRVSYNGGRGGVMLHQTAAQRAVANQRRFAPTPMQTRQRDNALRDPGQHFNRNRGRPPVFATQRAGGFANPQSERARELPRAAADARGPAGGFVRAPRDGVQGERRPQYAPHPAQGGRYNPGNREARSRTAPPARRDQKREGHAPPRSSDRHDKRGDRGNGRG
ncbi:MAG TPA: hypothetical protein VF292_08075 [Rhodanobacteraceae bacterium]